MKTTYSDWVLEDAIMAFRYKMWLTGMTWLLLRIGVLWMLFYCSKNYKALYF